MESVILIILAVGAYFLLKKNLVSKVPQYREAKIGAMIGVPLFYMYYSLSEVFRLWGKGQDIFNTTGYQHLLSGTDARWDANIYADAIRNMDDGTRNAWAFLSMAESASLYIAIIVVILCALMLYKLFNTNANSQFKYTTFALISAIACAFPYLLNALALSNAMIWVVFLIVVAVFGWTFYLYKKASLRLAETIVGQAEPIIAQTTSSVSPASEPTKQCPYCGETILAVAKKCKHCGEWLPEEKAEDKTEVLFIQCPICGEDIVEGTEICPFCGEPVSDK